LTSVGVWGIALLFLIAGAGARFALERRTARQFIGERCLRLLIPFAFATLTLMPLLLVLRSARGRRLTAGFAVLCEGHPGALFLLALPLGLLEAALGWQWQILQPGAASDGWSELAQLLFYGIVFVYGSLLYADERLRRVAQQDALLTLGLGVLVFVPTQFPAVGNPALAHDYSAGGLLAAFLRAFAAWMGVLGMVGLAMRFLPFTNRLGRYRAEASYPLYILHLPILYLLLLALPSLLTGETSALVRYLAIVMLTFACTLAARVHLALLAHTCRACVLLPSLVGGGSEHVLVTKV
jgi:peptidoglycan/LPS O-acetylase OafA/YrhL